MSRPFNTSTKLGKLLQDSGLKKLELGFVTRINERTLTDYLAGRKVPLPHHLRALCAVFEVEPEEILEER